MIEVEKSASGTVPEWVPPQTPVQIVTGQFPGVSSLLASAKGLVPIGMFPALAAATGMSQEFFSNLNSQHEQQMSKRSGDVDYGVLQIPMLAKASMNSKKAAATILHAAFLLSVFPKDKRFPF